jgi:uracil-DNA glycosylase family protein
VRTDAGPAAPVPERVTPAALRGALPACRACDLYAPATQAVAGEGPRHARVMLVGEQPGDREDIEGRPFVGPAGKVLDRALAEAGIDRSDAYLTNVVKHFRFRERGKRRIHQRPDRWQVNACLPWLDAERRIVDPDALVILGATAGQALLGSAARIGRDRGRPLDSPLAELVLLTAHPSAVLRMRDSGERDAAMHALVADLATVGEWLATH